MNAFLLIIIDESFIAFTGWRAKFEIGANRSVASVPTAFARRPMSWPVALKRLTRLCSNTLSFCIPEKPCCTFTLRDTHFGTKSIHSLRVCAAFVASTAIIPNFIFVTFRNRTVGKGNAIARFVPNVLVFAFAFCKANVACTKRIRLFASSFAFRRTKVPLLIISGTFRTGTFTFWDALSQYSHVVVLIDISFVALAARPTVIPIFTAKIVRIFTVTIRAAFSVETIVEMGMFRTFNFGTFFPGNAFSFWAAKKRGFTAASGFANGQANGSQIVTAFVTWTAGEKLFVGAATATFFNRHALALRVSVKTPVANASVRN